VNAISLDSLKGRSAFLTKTLRDFGFVDDVIVDPKFAVLAVVCHADRRGTWAFPYKDVRFETERIIVDERASRSPRVFLRHGRSYQDLIGAQTIRPDGEVLGHIKDVVLIDLPTGEIAYDVSPPGLRQLWSPTFRVRATDVVAEDHKRIMVVAEQGRTPTDDINVKEAA
jgi:uncharacterized protein YrrD